METSSTDFTPLNSTCSNESQMHQKKISPEDFILKAIQIMPRPVDGGIHNVFSNLNEALYAYYGRSLHVVDLTKTLVDKGLIVAKPVKRGMLFEHSKTRKAYHQFLEAKKKSDLPIDFVKNNNEGNHQLSLAPNDPLNEVLQSLLKSDEAFYKWIALSLVGGKRIQVTKSTKEIKLGEISQWDSLIKEEDHEGDSFTNDSKDNQKFTFYFTKIGSKSAHQYWMTLDHCTKVRKVHHELFSETLQNWKEKNDLINNAKGDRMQKSWPVDKILENILPEESYRAWKSKGKCSTPQKQPEGIKMEQEEREESRKPEEMEASKELTILAEKALALLKKRKGGKAHAKVWHQITGQCSDSKRTKGQITKLLINQGEIEVNLSPRGHRDGYIIKDIKDDSRINPQEHAHNTQAQEAVLGVEQYDHKFNQLYTREQELIAELELVRGKMEKMQSPEAKKAIEFLKSLTE